METFVFITDSFTEPLLQLLRVAHRAEEAQKGWNLCNTTAPSLQSPSFQNSHAVRNGEADRDGIHKLHIQPLTVMSLRNKTAQMLA